MQPGPTTLDLTGDANTRCPRCIFTPRRQLQVWSLLLGVVICLGFASHAAAQGLGRPNLLDDSNLPAGDGTTVEPGASRARFIRINSPLLTSPDSPLHQPAPAQLNLDSSRIELSLFDDTVITAALETTLYRNAGNYVASGIIDGWPGSSIIVVVDGEVIAASINSPVGVYQIRYDTNGFHKVLEIDRDRIPGCNLVRKAPRNPRPIKLSKRRNIPPIKGSEPGSFAQPPAALQAAGLFSPNGLDFTPPIAEPDPANNTNIDVMVVYTAAARVGAGGEAAMNTLIDLAVAEANLAYANSLIPVTLNLAYRGEVTYTESGNAATDLARLQNSGDGQMDAVHAIRNQYGADLVCLFTETMQATAAGLGYVMSNVSTNFSSYGFSVVRRAYATGNYTFAHELGHNMGCMHDRGNSSSQGAFDYSYGHRFIGNDSVTYRTVMAYAPGTRIAYFSNPNVNYQGTPTGVAAGATNSADNAASISNTMATVSAFRTPVVVFSFTTSLSTNTESTNVVAINVRRTGPTNAAVTVDYAMASGTATAGSDYTTASGTVNFAAGETNKTFNLALLEDDTKESTETLSLSLSNPSLGTMLTSNQTVYITDNDTSTIQFSSSGFTVSESTNAVALTLWRTGATNTAGTVNYLTVAGTATAGSDYTAVTGLVSFAAGETSKTFNVTVLNDVLSENAENFIVRLRTPTNTVLGTVTNFTLTIATNDRAIIAFSAATATVSETNGTLDVTLARTGSTDNTATVDFHTTNLTATAGSDYTATNGTVTFTNGQTSASITLVFPDDLILEGSETFRLLLFNPSDATLGTIRTNTVTITDDDTSTVTFFATTNSLSETNSSLTVAVIRTGVTNTAISVNYATVNGTALADADYTGASGLLTFAAGVTSNFFTLTLTNDLLQEVTETLQVRLSNPTNTTISAGTNYINLTDDDGSTIVFSHATTNITEDAGTITLTVERSGATNTAVAVRFFSTNGTAAAASDYHATNGLLSFAANEVSKTFDLRVINDNVGESSETVLVRLVSPTNSSLGTVSNLTATITTNDSAYVSWSVAGVSTNESTSAITLTVNRTGTTFNDVTVAFASTNVSAVAGADYYATNGTLTFTNGVTSQTISLRLIDDALQETNKTLQLRLSSVTDGIITNGTNTITITDDDASTLTLTTNAVTLAETNTSVTLTVIREGATNSPVAVDYTTTNVTASAGSDYTATSGTLYFAPGVTTNTIAITLAPDLSYESDETFRVVLSGITNSTMEVGTNTITITDDDLATVLFTTNAVTVAEDVGSVTVTAIRTGSTNTTVSVTFTNLGTSTATAGSDFTATNGLLYFAPGVTTNIFTVAIINDLTAENHEYVNYRIQNPTNCSVGTANHIITITTNDSAVLAWSIAATNISESGTNLVLTINRTGTLFNDASVDFATTNLTATAGTDYGGTNGTLTFTNGVTNLTVTLSITADDLDEADETLRVVLSNPIDAVITTRTNTVTINDDDSSTLNLTTNAVTLLETNTSVTLTVVRTGATNTAVAVDYDSTNVTATSGGDYTAASGTLYFAPGVTTNTIAITLTPDLTYETDETFRVILSGITNATLGVGTNTVTIDDDDLSYLGFSVASDSVNEIEGSIAISVWRTGVTNTSVSASFTTTNGTALSGGVSGDYTATNGTVSFLPGETNKTITVLVTFDDDLESNEEFRIRLLSITNAASATYTNIPITLTDAFGGLLAAGLDEKVEIKSVQGIGGEFVRLHIIGPVGTPFVIQSSPDLVNWTPVSQSVLGVGGFVWITPIDLAVPARYFRVVPPQ